MSVSSSPQQRLPGRGLRTTRARSLLGAAGVVVGIALLQGLPVAVAGEPDLMQTLLAQDVTLNNNLMPLGIEWEKSREGRRIAYGFGLEKQLSQRLEIELDGQWDSFSPRQGRDSGGVGSVDITLRYVFLTLPEQGFSFAAIGDLSLPANSRIGEVPMYPESGTALAWGGRLKGLPERGWTKYLRALEIQGDLGYSRFFNGSGSAEFFADPVFDYSFPYLNYETAGSVPWWLRYFCPFAELNILRVVGDGHDGPSQLFFMPGLALMTQTYQVSAGAQIALNDEAVHDKQVAVVASLLVFLDAIDPRFAWTPF